MYIYDLWHPAGSANTHIPCITLSFFDASFATTCPVNPICMYGVLVHSGFFCRVRVFGGSDYSRSRLLVKYIEILIS